MVFDTDPLAEADALTVRIKKFTMNLKPGYSILHCPAEKHLPYVE
jgi:hypothetical protein